ncbi:Glutamate/phenylalanine/leucine/valine dehydrogenase, bacterial/archaeal [Moorella glycerini]|uniref:Leucine dehydrogenase n=1 Tax=Neomoorella stamsii TaxID=1266720 RepID=A0A9X7P6L2_9FIRM|nr:MULTISPECIES: Glu/Leu/Phe/Val dehydrogenase dimerization domain-containing protein [Moorella]PRR73971.1 Leucine dehydrogenase [Moorella stamsii]CEP66182.1 Glutamate/phenylalanine/leucine/valine dehydrogenase, bacterial/archaeal [Moorella glycerini]
MENFKYMEKYGYEQLVMCHDRTSGLKAIICIHDTTLGPALGGLRMWPYASEEEAVLDALRLARGMTYKNAAAGLNLGGGKAVIIGNPRTDKSEELFRAFGRFVDTLGGRYITAEDVGTCVGDMEYIRLETKYVAGLADLSGDPSPVTAYGTYMGMKATALIGWGNDSLKGKVVAVQGLGHVGYALCRRLAEEGARLIVTDLDPKAVDRVVREFKATAVAPEDIYGVECDIYSPNALGGTINDQTIPQLKCNAIVGAANNQLKEERHGDILHEKGILYAPDYIVNAGGVINIAEEVRGYNQERALKKAAGIYDRVLKVFKIAEEYKIPTYVAADRLAEERIARIHSIHHTYVPR